LIDELWGVGRGAPDLQDEAWLPRSNRVAVADRLLSTGAAPARSARGTGRRQTHPPPAM